MSVWRRRPIGSLPGQYWRASVSLITTTGRVDFASIAASLPDEATMDLRAYYEGNRRYFWTLMTVFQAGYTAFGLYLFSTANEASGNDFQSDRPWVAAALLTLMALPTLVSAGLIFLKSRSSHYIGVGMLFALMLVHYAQARIA